MLPTLTCYLSQHVDNFKDLNMFYILQHVEKTQAQTQLFLIS